MMKKENYILLGLVFCFLSCKILQNQKPEITDCELISKIINQVDIIDEPYCYGFATIIADTAAGFKHIQRLNLNKKLSTYKIFNFTSCNIFSLANSKNVIVKPFKEKLVNSDTGPNEPIYSFENDQCYEIYVSEINNFEDKYAMFIGICNGKDNYFIHFLFKMDRNFNIYNINIMTYDPNISRPNYKDLSIKYPTLKSKYWESFGLPDK